MLGKCLNKALTEVALSSLVALLATSACAAVAATSNPTTSAANGTTVFELASDKLPAFQAQLVNGTQVDFQIQNWPTIVITPLGPAGPGKPPTETCTGTLVGPAVILLAAHCLDQRTNTLRTTYLKVDGVSLALTCAVDPDYLASPSNPDPLSPRRSEDIGLCYADTQVQLPSLKAMQFERVDIAPVSKNAAVMMMGFGCKDLRTQDQDHVLRVGNAMLSQPAGGTGPDSAYAEIESNGPPQPALCPGDSGGPLFTGVSVTTQALPRRVRGVNSSIETSGANLLSRISMLSHPSFVSWAKQWIAQFPNAYICGLTNNPVRNSCRL